MRVWGLRRVHSLGLRPIRLPVLPELNLDQRHGAGDSRILVAGRWQQQEGAVFQQAKVHVPEALGVEVVVAQVQAAQGGAADESAQQSLDAAEGSMSFSDRSSEVRELCANLERSSDTVLEDRPLRDSPRYLS
eukprot:CAMPEP_0173290386 /NCGR_PEP_ID=MMETSP1143-20121109/11532_1 /TAXON_ID=483371 /ORGANISM="non described non described, Strain CCMP2298" /LENGTH=132 /DNA_ID=CAMNT_0014229433 /DNA_START=107 /DNA_END=503 /DNA_ORIENTATION=+